VHVGSAAKSVVIEGCDATVVEGIDPVTGEPIPPSTAPHLAIDADTASTYTDVTVLSCVVRNEHVYIPLQVRDDSARSSLLAAARLRLPQLTTVVRDGLPELHDGDTIYGSEAHQLQNWDTSNWGSLATFQAADYPGLTSGVGPATLVANPIPGVYRISGVLICTTAAATASVTVSVNWRDERGTVTANLFTSQSLLTVNSYGADLLVRAFAGSPEVDINYTVTKTGPGGHFSCYLRAERL
jgi:hypothetical protein